MKSFTISEEDREKLVELYQKAQNTPVMALSVADGLAGRDFASVAWDEVRAFMDQLGKKYGYNPRTARMSIDATTFEAEEA